MPEQITNDELKWGYWYLTHRDLLRRIGVLALAAVGFVTMLYAGWQWIDWLTSRQAEEEAIRGLVSTTVNVADYRQRNSPLPLSVGLVTSVPAVNRSYDLVAQVSNPNPRWGMREFSYSFSAAGQSFSGTSFILPLEEKYLVVQGVRLPGPPGEVAITLGQTGWQRIRDLVSFQVPEFVTTDQDLTQQTAADNTVVGTRVSFKLTNASPWSFWRVGVVVVLTRRGSVQAVGRQDLGPMASGEERVVRLAWPGGAGGADSLVVKPEVNILDPGIFKPL